MVCCPKHDDHIECVPRMSVRKVIFGKSGRMNIERSFQHLGLVAVVSSRFFGFTVSTAMHVVAMQINVIVAVGQFLDITFGNCNFQRECFGMVHRHRFE